MANWAFGKGQKVVNGKVVRGESSGKIAQIECDLRYGGKIVREFYTHDKLISCSSEVLTSRLHTKWIYTMVDSILDDGTILVKTGEATGDAIDRYGNITCLKTINHRVLDVFSTNVGDKIIHSQIQSLIKNEIVDGIEWEDTYIVEHGSEEVYKIRDVESLNTFQNLVEQFGEKDNKNNVERRSYFPLYQDSFDIAMELVTLWVEYAVKGESPHFNCSLCPRFGKTTFALTTWLLCPARVMVMSSYIGTATNSYKKQVESKVGYEHVMVVDLTNMSENEHKEIEKKVMSWLNANEENRVLFLLPITGSGDDGMDDSTFSYRTKELIAIIKKLVKSGESYVVACDEVDYGAHCVKQVKKLTSISKIGGVDAIFKLSMSGTKAEIAQCVWGEPDRVFSVTYLDLLNCVKKNIGNK